MTASEEETEKGDSKNHCKTNTKPFSFSSELPKLTNDSEDRCGIIQNTKPETSESEFDGFQTPQESSRNSSPDNTILRVLRSRTVLASVEEDSDDGSEHSYESDPCSSMVSEYETDSVKDQLIKTSNEIIKEIKRSDTQPSEVLEVREEMIDRLKVHSSIDPSAYEIEEISDYIETDNETTPPKASLICDEHTGNGSLMENEGSFIKEELDIEDYVYYSDEELEETILSNLEKGKFFINFLF